MDQPMIVRPVEGIARVQLIEPVRHGDDRGWMSEVFRANLVGLETAVRQVNLSVSRRGVLRGLHFHHRQYDYWIVAEGRMRAGLADVRRGSPTEGNGRVVDLSEGMGLLIPPGVAHGFAAVTDLRLFYLVTEYFDGSDEFGVAWDDADLALDWNLDFAPLLSDRDRKNPRWSRLALHERPGFGS